MWRIEAVAHAWDRLSRGVSHRTGNADNQEVCSRARPLADFSEVTGQLYLIRARATKHRRWTAEGLALSDRLVRLRVQHTQRPCLHLSCRSRLGPPCPAVRPPSQSGRSPARNRLA